MKTDEIRQAYLDFFKGKGHPIIPSDSLIPQNDPTLLFTGAGMNQFKDYFLGIRKDLKCATSSQKCLRTGDLDQVGKTPYHHSFFEMLGNFSFGDYFKKEAIHWAWEFLTKTLGISGEKLSISVHKNDDEAYQIWLNEIKIPVNRIYKLGDKGNFWPSNAPADGPNGPCGPCSEIYFDQGIQRQDGHACTIECDCGRFTEIWNLVFTQFDRQDGGKLVPLKQKNIDTGMGLERLACVLQGKKSNYEIDIFDPINQAVAFALELPASFKSSHIYAISDHVRAVTFAITDGVIPSNDGRGYVIRKLIRRALWHAYQVLRSPNLSPWKELKDPFLYKVSSDVVEVMKKSYPELCDAASSVRSTLQSEEDRFLATLDSGMSILKSKLSVLKSKMVPGEIIFELYDTYGFPDELTRIISEERGFKIDQAGFDKLMEEQRKRAKDATKIAASIFVTSEFEARLAKLPPTVFLGYDRLEAEGKVLLAEISGGTGVLVLDHTPMYAESGGQVGDKGRITGKNFKAKVTDTQKKDKCFLHAVEIEQGSVKEGDKLTVTVDSNWRSRAMRNHTATHLLHAALRQMLGPQVRQLGSLVSPEKLRFDYSYGQALSREQIKSLEDTVNEQILSDIEVSRVEKSIDEAKKEGAIAFFGEKYGDKVRVVTVADFSKELCGGTHCSRTGQIGAFVITSDSSVASGVRRIEALTGEGALDYLRTLRTQISEISQSLRSTPAELPVRIAKLQESLKQLEKDKKQGTVQAADPGKILDEAASAGQFRFATYKKAGVEIEELRRLSDTLQSRSGKTVYLLGTENEDKIHCLLGMSSELKKTDLDLRDLFKEISDLLKASGGGRKDLIQAGAKNQGQLASPQWDEIVSKAVRFLKDKKL